MRATRHILMILLVTAATLGVALAAPPPKGDPAKAPPPGSTLAAQKKLAARLNAIKGVSLAQVLGHNRSEWDRLSPDQRDRFRQQALAFLNQSPEQQEKLLDQYQKLVSLSAERRKDYREIAQWLKTVVDSFTPEQRKALLEMPPEQRAKTILDRKAELIRQGKLPPDPSPASLPAPSPASRPPG